MKCNKNKRKRKTYKEQKVSFFFSSSFAHFSFPWFNFSSFFETKDNKQ